jgi:hypothetical protein
MFFHILINKGDQTYPTQKKKKKSKWAQIIWVKIWRETIFFNSYKGPPPQKKKFN